MVNNYPDSTYFNPYDLTYNWTTIYDSDSGTCTTEGFFPQYTTLIPVDDYFETKKEMLEEARKQYRFQVRSLVRHKSYQRSHRPREVLIPDIEAQQKRKLIMTQRKWQ